MGLFAAMNNNKSRHGLTGIQKRAQIVPGYRTIYCELNRYCDLGGNAFIAMQPVPYTLLGDGLVHDLCESPSQFGLPAALVAAIRAAIYCFFESLFRHEPY